MTEKENKPKKEYQYRPKASETQEPESEVPIEAVVDVPAPARGAPIKPIPLMNISDMNDAVKTYEQVSNIKSTSDREGKWLEFNTVSKGKTRHMRVLRGKIV